MSVLEISELLDMPNNVWSELHRNVATDARTCSTDTWRCFEIQAPSALFVRMLEAGRNTRAVMQSFAVIRQFRAVIMENASHLLV